MGRRKRRGKREKGRDYGKNSSFRIIRIMGEDEDVSAQMVVKWS
jgi:hypothetical protein